jgi:hypothetical protein
MAFSGMLRRVSLVRTDVSEEFSASFIRVARIGELGTTLTLTSNRSTLRLLLVTASVVPSSPILVTLMKEALSSFETSVITRATRRNIPEDYIHHCLFIYLRAEPKSLRPVTNSTQVQNSSMGHKTTKQQWGNN